MNSADDITVDLPEMKALRKELHSYPEIGLEETRTAAFIAGHLKALGYQVHRGFAKTAVVGTLRNGGSNLIPATQDDGRISASQILHVYLHDTSILHKNKDSDLGKESWFQGGITNEYYNGS